MVKMRDQEIPTTTSPDDSITEHEAALYDRQIRLWGLDCQKRLREARILVIGMNGLGAEVVKNLTLSGVKSITIMDEIKVTDMDTSAQFFAMGSEPGQSRAHASRSAIEELNPNVKIDIDAEPLEKKTKTFYAQFAAIFATHCPLSTLINLNKICRELKILFFSSDTYGFHGYGFLDLLSHKYVKSTQTQDKGATTLLVNEYCSIGSALGAKVGMGLNKKVSKDYILMNIMYHFHGVYKRFPHPAHREEDVETLKKIRGIVCADLGFEESRVDDNMLSNVFGELSPVCAAVGGVMANEIIKGLSGKGEPIYNFFLFDGETCTGMCETIIVRE